MKFLTILSLVIGSLALSVGLKTGMTVNELRYQMPSVEDAAAERTEHVRRSHDQGYLLIGSRFMSKVGTIPVWVMAEKSEDSAEGVWLEGFVMNGTSLLMTDSEIQFKDGDNKVLASTKVTPANIKPGSSSRWRVFVPGLEKQRESLRSIYVEMDNGFSTVH